LPDKKTAIAKYIIEKENLDSTPRYLRKLVYSAYERIGKQGFEPVTETKTNQYDKPFILSAVKDGTIMNMNDYCVHFGLPRNDVKSYKLVTHTGTPFYNIAFHEHQEEVEFLTADFFEDVVNKCIDTPKYATNISEPFTAVLRAIITDVHIGMNPNKEGIYDGVWDYEEQLKRFSILADSIIEKAIDNEADELIIDDLGDFMDGWDGFTARKGHSLPQNMTNEEAFEAGVKLKVFLFDRLAGLFNSITMNNITNDNHSASFGYIVNSAVKSIIEAKYGNAK